MNTNPRPVPQLFGTIDVSANPNSAANTRVCTEELVVSLLRQMATVQEKQTALMEQMVAHLSHNKRQRDQELHNWKEQNPKLAKNCKLAADTLVKVQTHMLKTITGDVIMADDDLVDSDFMLNEFVDRFGPRLAHLNGILQVLAQLGSNTQTEEQPANEA